MRPICRFVPLFALAVARPPVSARAVEDVAHSLFENSGFENGLEAWSFTKGWGKMDEATKRGAIEVRTDRPRSGRKYIRVTNRGERFHGLQQEVRFDAGIVYKISWWDRGRAQSVGHEKGSTRLRIWGYGGPEYTEDVPYHHSEWTYHEHAIYSTRNARGGMALWVWPNGHCDIDDLMIRRAFWKSDRPDNAMFPGETMKLTFDTPHGTRGLASVVYRIVTSDGKTVRDGRFEGKTPLSKTIEFAGESEGYYRLEARVRTGGAEFEDRLGICVLARETGLDGVKAQWGRPARR